MSPFPCKPIIYSHFHLGIPSLALDTPRKVVDAQSAPWNNCLMLVGLGNSTVRKDMPVAVAGNGQSSRQNCRIAKHIRYGAGGHETPAPLFCRSPKSRPSHLFTGLDAGRMQAIGAIQRELQVSSPGSTTVRVLRSISKSSLQSGSFKVRCLLNASHPASHSAMLSGQGEYAPSRNAPQTRDSSAPATAPNKA